MNIIISPDIYIHYFNTFSKPTKTDKDLDIQALISNSNNKHILSRALIDLIEKSFSQDIVSQVVGPFMTEIADKKSLNIAGKPSDDYNEVLAAMLSNNKLLRQPYNISAAISLNAIAHNFNGNLLIVTSLNKPDFSWLLFKIACYNPMAITLRYSDFSNNSQIQALFDGMSNLCDANDQPVIFDRQINLNHRLFNGINGKIIHYYTARGNSIVDSDGKCRSIISNLRRARVYMAGTDKIHERKLIIGNYIIEVDEDFWNLTVTRSTWKIDITYCVNTVKVLVEKKQQEFHRQIPK